jgi:hypothetical protein
MSSDSEGPIEETGVLDHLFGVWYPTHHVVGVGRGDPMARTNERWQPLARSRV